METKWKDRIADPKKDPACVENIGELFMDTSKIQMMCLLNCDEKYKKKRAADFELLKEWEEILPLCKGSGAAMLYEAETRWLADEMEISDRWSKGCERLFRMDLSEYSPSADQVRLDRLVTDFAKETSEKNDPLSALVCQMTALEKASGDGKFHLILPMLGSEFIRPNPYASNETLKRLICGEKCNDMEWSSLLLQAAISFVRARKNAQGLVLHLFSEHSYAPLFEAIDYLRDHRLFAGELRFGILLDTARQAHAELCDLFSKWTEKEPFSISLELILTVADFAQGLSDRMAALFRLYPKGSIRLGGVLTDSPAYFVADRLALEAWNAQ